MNTPVRHRRRMLIALAALLVFTLFISAQISQAGPTSVTLVGSLQDELGCPGDWQPDCAATFIAEQGYDVWRGAFAVPAGDYAYKMALNGTWDEAYPAGDKPISVPADSADTIFYFDYKTKAVLDTINDEIAVAAGTLQSALGCPDNWQPWCVNTLLTDVDGDGVYALVVAPGDLPAGDYEFKVALDEDWATSYPGSNMPFTVNSADEAVTITWDSVTTDVMVDVSVPETGPSSVTLAGSLQSELGCDGDWDPSCAATHLANQGNGVWRGEFSVPEGDYAYKMALNNTWDEAYPAGDKPITVPADPPATRFYFDHKTKAVHDSINDVIAVAAGSFQEEIGCPGDWQPSCVISLLTDADGDGVYAFMTSDIPVGDYEFKVALDEDWAIAYPANNVPFSVMEAGKPVTITFDSADNSVNVQVGTGDVDLSLTAPLLSHPIQEDVFYFAMTDRFKDGDPTNNEGAAPGGTLAETGFLIDDKSFYHGGDLVGMTSMLDYIDDLGATAIWITPVFGNMPTGPDSSTAFGFGASYHGYWILDFENADAHLGTNAELQAFIDAAHGRGMKVFFDIVVNHTADVIDYAEAPPHNYIEKADVPYVDADGNEFDDRDFIGLPFPAMDPATSFPYTPTFADPGDDVAKNPAWLNDPTLYHNRGDSTFVGESSQYGDFFGLDDTFTENQVVVDGFIDIFKQWITDYNIDGYRLDTVKHVNTEFWQAFAPEIMDHAMAQGNDDFFMFGEVFDGNPAFLSTYTTEGMLPSVLDFGMHGNASGFAVNSNPTNNLRDFFANDDYYTDADSNAYSLANFISNHDIGRIGHGLRNAAYPDAEALDRTELAHGLMYFARGFPVVYYGDEQGFVGGGSDKLSREDMFASQVPEFNTNDLIGTEATTADDNFDMTHPLYQTLATYADVRGDSTALQTGAQIHRYSTDGAGIYAFSRIDRDERVEYLVVLNNANSEQNATIGTYSPNTTFMQVYPPLPTNAPAGLGIGSDGDGNVSVTVPALGVAVYAADTALSCPTEAAVITISSPTEGGMLFDRAEVVADVAELTYTEVTFAAKVGDGEFEIIGTDGSAPYRVFFDTSGLAPETPVTFQAVADDLCGNLSGAAVSATVGAGEEPSDAPPYTIIHYNRPADDYGDHTTGDFNDFWGLHLWGDAIDPSEVTAWEDPKPFLGETDFGRFAFIKLDNVDSNVNFIIHKGNDKDTPDDRFYDPAVTPEIWVNQGDPTHYPSQALAQGFVTFHYNRPGDDYDGWGLHLWQDGLWGTDWSAPHLPDGFDDYGAYFIIDTTTYPDLDLTQPLNFIMHRGDDKDPPDSPDRQMDPNDGASVWLKQDDVEWYPSRGAATDTATIHYHRPAGDYGDYTSSDYNDFWGLHTWNAADDPGWTTPRTPAYTDTFGVAFEVPLTNPDVEMGYILHRGDEKDPGPDQFLDFDTWGFEVWQVQGADPEQPYVYPILFGPPGPGGDIDVQSAYWVSENTIAWAGEGNAYMLCYAADGGMTLDAGMLNGADGCIDLTYDSSGLPQDVRDKFPHLAELPAYTISAEDLALVPDILKAQIAIVATDGEGLVIDGTGLQIPGVLDDLYTYDGPLGVTFNETRGPSGPINLTLWAPTARNVTLHLFDDADPATTSTALAMNNDAASGTWSIDLDADAYGKYYVYEVEVYVHASKQVENNMVTDPYALSLSLNSGRTQIVDLADPALKPAGWDDMVKPEIGAPEEISVYEIHVRDFSIFDETVQEDYRGKYLAFTQMDSAGMQHLQALSDAGLTHLHLLPAFDIATINENEAERTEPDPDELATYPPNSDQQQAIVTALGNEDGFNWGYDPFHYTAPEGSYATDPDGPQRILEFRQMVQGLNDAGLRVVMDVVYNHTNASGQNDKSVLDKIVPGYYHRLNDMGEVEKSTCCDNTASEHNMMERLMIDSLLVWAAEYKVDAFRFDLMGHHMKSNMLAARDELAALTMENDGVDGSSIYIYGEGWNFGEVADNARGVNATQLNMAGTGIGTFSDRLRDAVRGGGPFDDGDALQNQGFANGLHYDPNGYDQGDTLAKLLLATDQIRVGMAGNLADFMFIDRNGNLVTGAEVDYNGSPAGYTEDPQEVITYISKHDNQTLYDINVYGAPVDTSMADRVRIQNVGLATVMYGQGVPFFHAGVDLLRSKSLDRDSYNSGDWFNRLDFSYQINNFGVGLPVAEKNQSNWYLMEPLLGNPALMPDSADIEFNAALFREALSIRYSTPLFQLQTKQQVMDKVLYHNTGPDQMPGVIVMSISDLLGDTVDPNVDEVAVVINATTEPIMFSAAHFAGRDFGLHPAQMNSVDGVVRTSGFDSASGTFSVPARTAAVFVDGVIPTAVELDGFDATVDADGTVTLNWATSAEVNTAGFNVFRMDATGAETQVNAALIASNSVGGSGGSYTLADAPAAGTWTYVLEEVETDGTTTRIAAVTVETQAPTSATLSSFDGALGGNVALIALMLVPFGIAGLWLASRRRKAVN